jgi:hypothetical protein
MKYTKPEVAVLGEAVRVIEMTLQKLHGTVVDPTSGQARINPAYDLDE